MYNQTIQAQGTAFLAGSAQSGSINARQQDYASTAPCQPPKDPPSLVADTARDLLARGAAFHALVDRITRVTDRVFGSDPAGSANSATPEPYCDVARLHQAMQYLDLAIDRLEQQVRRVEQV